MQRHTRKPVTFVAALATLLASCAPVNVPDARNVDIPEVAAASPRPKAINDRPDSVMYLPLGDDVLVPEVANDEALPSDRVGPFELRGETLAGALQLILAEYDISLAFETDQAFSRYVTVSNLHGNLDKVVDRVCSLANLYCSFQDNTLLVKDTQSFAVTIPPLGVTNEDGQIDTQAFLDNVAGGLAAVLGNTTTTTAGSQDEDGQTTPATTSNGVIVDSSTRTLIYNATQRTAELAERYFQRLRANTALIVYETYIWEVNLNAANSTGIEWDMIDQLGKFNTGISLQGNVSSDFTNPVSIGLPTTDPLGNVAPTDVVRFLSQFGAVKSVSQPQITVMSGSNALLRVAETENYVAEIQTTLTDNNSTTAVETDSVDSGFTLTIGSSWDRSTVYSNIRIQLTDVLEIENFAFSDGGDEGTSTSVQLPLTTERELTTQVRIRPGDSLLIAGLVQETDDFDSRGPGLMEPIIPDSRTALTNNMELVFLLRPRVVVYTSDANQAPVTAAKKSAVSAVSYESAPREGLLSMEPVEAAPTGNSIPPAPAPVSDVPPAVLPPPSSVSAPVAAPVPTTSPTSSSSSSVRGNSTYTPSFSSGGRVSSYSARAEGTYDSAIPPAPSNDSLQAPYNSEGYGSGYVSKYLTPGTTSGADSGAGDSSGAVEIYDIDGAAPSSTSSDPVPLSDYSTYGAQ